jgi:DNA replication protein DnaC
MKYIKLYEQFRLILEKLDSQGKQLFLLCGPSATGKTYLAGQIGINHWTKSSDFKGG